MEYRFNVPNLWALGAEMANAATLKSPQAASPYGSRGLSPLRLFALFAMLSHRGRVRHTNQDACAALPEGVSVVCDGMAGAAGGEVASHLASEAFLHALSRTCAKSPSSHPGQF